MSLSKGRILEHMNKDHRLSLFDYLAYYGGIRLDYLNSKHHVELVDVAVDHIVLNYTKGSAPRTIKIVLNPPMSSLSDTRSRFIAMSYEAADGMHVSPYQVKKHLWTDDPVGWFFATMTAITTLTLVAPRPIEAVLSRVVPNVAAKLVKHARRIASITLLIHFWEYLYFLRHKLKVFRVEPLLQWKWFLSAMLIGYPQWKRFDEEAARLEAQRQTFEKPKPVSS